MQFSWTHSFPASCISDMNSIVCGMAGDFSYFWIKSNAPTYSSSHWAWRLSKRGQTTQIPEKNEQLLCSVKSLGELLRIEKANYLSFESWGWHGAHIFASTGLASWMNSEFPQENIFRTESQPCVQCLVCCVYALYICFVFVLSIYNLCFRVVLFCASFLCLYLLFTLCFFLVSVHCICIQHSYWRSCLFMFCDCDLCGVFVHSVRSFCLCMFVLCACLCFVLAICICFVFVICALWLFLLCIYTLCMSFVFLPCVCACTVSFAVARFVALAGSFGA